MAQIRVKPGKPKAEKMHDQGQEEIWIWLKIGVWVVKIPKLFIYFPLRKVLGIRNKLHKMLWRKETHTVSMLMSKTWVGETSPNMICWPVRNKNELDVRRASVWLLATPYGRRLRQKVHTVDHVKCRRTKKIIRSPLAISSGNFTVTNDVTVQ